MQDEPLQQEAVYARLRWQWAWRGLTLVHLGAALAPPILLWPLLFFAQETIAPGASLLYALPAFFAAIAFVFVIQYRRPSDSFSRELQCVFEPRILCPVKAEANADLKARSSAL